MTPASHYIKPQGLRLQETLHLCVSSLLQRNVKRPSDAQRPTQDHGACSLLYRPWCLKPFPEHLPYSPVLSASKNYPGNHLRTCNLSLVAHCCCVFTALMMAAFIHRLSAAFIITILVSCCPVFSALGASWHKHSQRPEAHDSSGADVEPVGSGASPKTRLDAEYSLTERVLSNVDW